MYLECGMNKAEDFLRGWLRTYRTEFLLFLLLWITYTYFYQSTQHNEAARFDQMRAMVQDRGLEIDKYWWNTADVIRYAKDGASHVYPNKAPGMVLLAVLPFAIFSIGLSPFRSLGLPEWIYWHGVTYLTTIFTVSLFSALAAVAMYRVLNSLIGDKYLSLLAIVAVWLGTLAFPFSTLFFSHQLVAALLAIAFYLLFKVGHGEIKACRSQLLCLSAAGLLMSISVAAEYPTILLISALSVYAVWVILRCQPFWKDRVWLMAAWTLGILVGAGALITYNVAAFGKPFYIPYESYAKTGASFSQTYGHGVLGLRWLGLHHFLQALAAITIHPQIGMLYIGVQEWRVYACSPVLWVSLPGLAIMIWKRHLRAEGLLVAAMTCMYLLFITSYGTWAYDWSGAVYYGSRHTIPLLPFLALPLCFGARLLRFVFYPLLAISIFYMLLATAIEPRAPVPFENPARDSLLPDYFRGRFAQNTSALFDGQRNLTKDSTAFNLGKLAGFPGAYQLTPLMLWWLIAGGALLLQVAKHDGVIEAEQLLVGKEWVAKAITRFANGRLVVLLLFVTAISLPPIIIHAAASLRHPSHGLLGKYYRNANWSGSAIDAQVDPEINFDWAKTLPLPPPFSVEWTGNILISEAGEYTFSLVADDGALLEIDGRVIVDASHALLQKRSGVIHLNAGLHSIRVRYFNVLFGGSVRLTWVLRGRPEQVIPTEVLVPSTP
ncbi:MAG: PA14 domain protein [Candidatus Udaeobacter sp.]|nr:MAG: PA14 domain protein [Candidatus Udaeobacter sp.]